MSGLSTEKKGGNNIYLKVMNGKLVQTVKADTEGAIERVNKEGATVHELHYTGVTALIKNIAIIDAKFGKELEVKMSTGGQNFVIQTAASGGYAYGFFTRMSNLDFTKETEIRPFAIPNEKDKTKTNHVIVLYQADESGKMVKVESAFTKENPNGLPALETIKDAKGADVLKAGKPIWDDTKRLEFFESIIYGDNGVNDALIALYGTAEQSVANESKDNFLEEVNAPIHSSGDDNALDFDAEADKQKEAILTADKAVKAEPKKAAAKKPVAKKK